VKRASSPSVVAGRNAAVEEVKTGLRSIPEMAPVMRV
jgi:hypothetical protein